MTAENFSLPEDFTVEDIVNAKPATATDTREAWLLAATDLLRPVFGEIGETVPEVRISVGWPGGGSKNTRIGECWASSASADKKAQIFISPLLDDAVAVLSTLVHELVHAIDDCQSGHRGRFAKIAKAVGLEGKMTATVPGEALAARLEGVIATLGPYPHAAIRLATARVTRNPEAGPETEIRTSGPKKQGTRMLKVVCEVSGYTVRMTRKWIEEVGTPICPCHSRPMVEA